MERHIGIWNEEKEDEKYEAGELIIDGNRIEFYSRFPVGMFPTTYIGDDGNMSYKVFVNGAAKASNRKTLDYSYSHRVFFVLMQNYQFSKGVEINGIKEVSFEIPELIRWFGIKTVSYASSEQGDPGAMELKFPTIVLNEKNTHIEVFMVSKTFNSTIMERGDNTTITIKKNPRISISYDNAQDINTVLFDIECIMQFFGLLIGSVSDVEDIRLSIENQKCKSRLYINRDFSYNLRAKNIFDNPRTYYYVLKDNLMEYYMSWQKFCEDDTYSLLRRVYFSANDRKDIFAEQIFVEYMRFLDGYHTRISGDEQTKKKIKDSLKECTTSIKKLLFNEDGKALFEETMKKADPEWKCNSAHIGEIAGWIAAGYLGKTQLSYRLMDLDKKYLSIISNNAFDIERNVRSIYNSEGKNNEDLVQTYFKELGDTRNYYSHYKLDKSGVFDMWQINLSINVLKATIITILYSHMNMDMELIRRIIEFDTELHDQTMFLRQPDEFPFPHPSKFDKDTVD